MKKLLLSLLAVATLATLYGCGGGSSSSGPASTPELTGTVASGAPVPLGTKVTIKDANGASTSTTTLDDKGLYKVSVGNLTPPFVICVDTTSPPPATPCAPGTGSSDKVIMSIANQAGTANVTPLTKLALASAAGVADPTDVYNTLATLKTLTADKITQGMTTIKTVVGDYLKYAGIDPAQFNLLTTPFTADHKGIDSVMDQVKPSLAANGVVTLSFPNNTSQPPVTIADITKFAQYSSTVRNDMKNAWPNVANLITPLPGVTPLIPDNVTLPPGFTLPANVMIPASVTLPPNFVIPAGATLQSGITLPSGVMIPNGVTIPSGITIPPDAILPIGFQPPGATTTLTASGTYTFSDGSLVFTTTASTFPNEPMGAKPARTVTSITATTMTIQEPMGSSNWTRSSGTAGSIIGTWTMGPTTLTFNSDLTYTVAVGGSSSGIGGGTCDTGYVSAPGPSIPGLANACSSVTFCSNLQTGGYFLVKGTKIQFNPTMMSTQNDMSTLLTNIANACI